ncbi:hypothetical protein HPB47_003116 [Ixodes persulcatus]|uniref:Uncharacterized protein n=1 Tax=Ixodes persulcatus TaxID=34615 RepID=A0AC60PJR3_IXOPE|nr:hypothetical protein HPB47_003116 [Ixodes persulcatus]
MSPIEWLSTTVGKAVFGTTTALCGLAALLFGIFAYNRLTLGRCKSKNRMDGKTVVITGANTGIGYETAKELASRGARVILGCRNAQKAEAAVDQLVADTRNSNISWKLLDTSSMESVRTFAMEVLKATDSIHVLINNAGIAGVTANVLHPGVVNTPLSRSLMKVGEPVFGILSTIFGVKSLVEGAQTSIHLAVADEVSDVSGAYFVDCKPKALSGRGRDPAAATKLWEASCRLVGMEDRELVP